MEEEEGGGGEEGRGKREEEEMSPPVTIDTPMIRSGNSDDGITPEPHQAHPRHLPSTPVDPPSTPRYSLQRPAPSLTRG